MKICNQRPQKPLEYQFSSKSDSILRTFVMCFFLSCTTLHKPTHYFKGACNQFDFGVNSKSKDQLSISNNSDGSSTLVFSFKTFQKWLKKTLFLGVWTPLFSRKPELMKSFWFVFRGQNTFGNNWSHLICTKKIKFAGCVLKTFCLMIKTPQTNFRP